MRPFSLSGQTRGNGFGLRISTFFRISDFGLRISLCAACFGSALSLLAAESDIRRDATVAAVEQLLPCVVNVATETLVTYHDAQEEMLRRFFGWPAGPGHQQRSLDLGSGVIISEEGDLLTNQHVVRQANRIQVKLWDGREYEAERIAESETRDVALLRIKAKPGERFKAVKFAPEDDLLLGETVLALGNPFGLGGSVSRGILSSKNRRSSTGNETLDVDDWLQTDAAINPGNSGGPLTNLRGELIGLNVATVRPEQGHGVSFAVPVKQINEALSGFLSPESAESLWFGARVKTSGTALAIHLVQPGSPAEKAGLRKGDQVLQVNGRSVGGLFGFNRSVSESPNHEVSLVIQRGGEKKAIKVRMLSFQDLIRQKLGCTLLELTPQTAGRLGIKAGEGLFIEEVEKDGPADRGQLQRGYLLSSIAGQPTSEIKAAADLLSGKKKGEQVSLTVIVPRRLGANFMEFRQGKVEVTVR
jgi:S1-C subfamily serine protease